MDFFVTADAHWEARLGEVLAGLAQLRAFVHEHEYGSGLDAIAIVLMCRDPELTFSRRKRFDRRSRVLSFDVMLNLHEFRAFTPQQRRERVATELLSSLSSMVPQYSLATFEFAALVHDVQNWFEQSGWLTSSATAG